MPPQKTLESRKTTVQMLGPNAPVPKLRSDLEVRIAEGEGGDTIELVDAAGDATHVLQDVEFSIARMLNGKRTASEVLAAAEKLGLPLNLESLSHFVGKLARLNLLAKTASARAEAPDPGRTFPQRREWPDPVRVRYQDALRAFRQDNLEVARAELEKLLETDAENVEALALLKKLDEREAGESQTPFAQTWSVLETSWFEEGAVAAPDDVAEAFGPRAPSSKLKLPIALVATAVVLLVLALVPLPYTVSAPCTLKPRSATQVLAPRGGVLESVDVKEGEWVTAGKVLARYDGAEIAKRLASVEEKLEAAKKPKKASPSPAALKAAGVAVEKARAELKKSSAAAKKAKKPAQAAAAKKEAAARLALEKASAALEALKAPPAGPAPALAVLESEREKLEAQTKGLQVVAPADGAVAALTARPGSTVSAQGALLRLDDTRTLLATVTLAGKDARSFAVDQQVTVTVGAKRFKVKVTAVKPEITAAVENAAGTLAPGAAGELVLEGLTRSLVGRL